MHRTTIMLPPDLKQRAAKTAAAREISLGELIRRALEDHLDRDRPDYSNDPFFLDTNFYDGPVPPDLSARHDDYLYEEEERRLYGNKK